MRISHILALAAAAIFATGTMNASNLGSQGFTDLGSPTPPSVAPGTSINTASTYNIGNLLTTGSDTGFLGGMTATDGIQFLGPISFDITIPNSFVISNTAFGTFTSTSIARTINQPGSVTIFILGDYNNNDTSNYCSGCAGPIVNDIASFTLTWNQNPVDSGAISDSGTFSDPPGPSGSPEPATLGLFGSALIGLGLVGRKRLAKK